MLLSAIRGKLAMWLLLLCIATSAAAQDPCNDVTMEGKVVSRDPLTVDTTLDIAARFKVGKHDTPEIRVKLITRGAGADLVEVLVTGSTVTINGNGGATTSKCAGVDCGSNGTCDPTIGTCACVNDYKGDFCQLGPENCRDGVKNGAEVEVDCGGPDCHMCTEYRWFAEEFGECSVSCGGGLRVRKVWCEDKNKPGLALPTNQPCRELGLHEPGVNDACGASECASYQWEYAEWADCTAVCGGGTRTRDAWCSSSLAAKPVSDSLCDVKEKKETSQDCNQGICDTYHWVTDWDDCSLTCGTGVQSATSTCMTKTKEKATSSSMCKDKMPLSPRACNKAPCPVAEGTGKWTPCPWDACTTECGGSGSTMSGSQSRVVLCRDPITGAVTDPALCTETDRPREILNGCNPMLCASPYWMSTPWASCNAAKRTRTRTFHCHDKNGENGFDSLCKDTGVPLPVAEEACEVNACPIPTTKPEDGPTISWAAATSCPAPLLPLAVAATAWAVTPPGGPSRRVTLASSLALAAWTVSRVDAQASGQECTSPLEIELEVEFPRSGSLGYDQVMQNGGIILPDTVRLVGCVPGYVLQKATGLCESSITDFDVYAEPSSKAFNKWSPDARYSEECPTYIHDMFAVLGEDGKVYPTWHPPVYTDVAADYTCAFGHEHGDDPSTSTLFASERVPFGYVNEQHYAADSTRQRHESHEGHKLQVGNDVKICYLNDEDECEGKKHIATCQVVIKIHQGTSSNDAFTNNGHEVFLFIHCEGAGSSYYLGTKPRREVGPYGVLDVNIKYLNLFSLAGKVDSIDRCPFFPETLHLQVDLGVLPIVPADSPDGEGSRRMVDNTCIDDHILVKDDDNTRTWGTRWALEHWVVHVPVRERAGSQTARFSGNPYIFVYDAARYYDATSPETKFVKYFVDLCYVKGKREVRDDKWCAQVRQEDSVVTWDDPRSPWKGAYRDLSPNNLKFENPGPATVFYSNTYGEDLVTDPSVCGPDKNGVGCIKQHIGLGYLWFVGADILLPVKNWAVPSTHSPN